MHRKWVQAVAACAGLVAISSVAPAAVMINEIDYDQIGTDTTEFIELTATAGTNLSGWTLELVNGNDNTVYKTVVLPNFTFSDETGTGWGFFVAGRAAVANNDLELGADNSVQNGSPDGARLLNPSLAVVHYVAYEGSMPGSTDDVPVATLDDNLLAASSIYKTGTGSSFGDFTWAYGANSNTPGAINVGQTLTTIPEPGAVSMIIIGAAGMLIRRARRRAV